MALILLDWLYCFFTLTGMGFWAIHLFKIKTQNLFYIITAGIFLEMLLLHFALIWFPANEFFYLFNFLFGLGGIYFRLNSFKKILCDSIKELKNWSKIVKVLAFFIIFSILAKSASLPYLVDNESYYLQTIKWMNEFGLVKGLANLHIFLGQMSGWHLLQSAFNFGFYSNSLNDLNGFVLICFSLFALSHLNEYLKNKKIENLFLGLIICTNVLLFQFVTTPSPDLPVFLISQLIFYLFITNFKNYQGEFNLMLILSVMLVLVKITGFPILILAFIIAVKHKLIAQKFSFILFIGLISGFAFLLKNYIISGYPMYPTSFAGNLLSPDWKVPQEIQSMYLKLSNDFGWKHLSTNEVETFSFWKKLYLWTFKSKGFELIFNSVFLIILAIFPFIIKRKKAFWFIWGLAVLQLFILLLTSPQYRFFMQFSIGLWFILIAKILYNKVQLVKFFISVSVVITFVSIFIDLDLKTEKFTNYQPDTFSSFEWKETLIPHKNSRYDLEFKQVKEGNLIYNSAIKNDFFWGSFDAEVPAANEILINWIKDNYNYRPQLRTNNPKDGFYSENLRK